jgi:hypothetical protein
MEAARSFITGLYQDRLFGTRNYPYPQVAIASTSGMERPRETRIIGNSKRIAETTILI